MRNLYFGFGFWASLERKIDEIKNSYSEIIFKLPHLLFAPITEFSIFVGHPNAHNPRAAGKKLRFFFYNFRPMIRF